MGSLFAPAHLIVIAILLLIIFKRGQFSDLMEDLALGIKRFQKALKDDGNLTDAKEDVPSKKKDDLYHETIIKADGTVLGGDSNIEEKEPSVKIIKRDGTIEKEYKITNEKS